MSELNGKRRPLGIYREAALRHKAEKTAWRVVVQAQISARGPGQPAERDTALSRNHGRVAHSRAQGDGSRAINGLKELADELAAAADLSNGHADGELADEGLTAEAAELPAGGPASTWGSLRTPTIVGDATGWRATFAGSNGTATDEPEGLVELPPIDPGPMDENEALDRALRLPEVAVELAKLVQLGNATDLEILEILKGWPTHRWTPASPGQPWATHGDSKLAGPGFFYGHSARIAWPQGPAFLEGGALVKAVRKQLGLKLPRISRAEAKATFDEPAAPAPPAAPMTAREKRNARDRARRAREKGTSVPYVPSGAAVHGPTREFRQAVGPCAPWTPPRGS